MKPVWLYRFLAAAAAALAASACPSLSLAQSQLKSGSGFAVSRATHVVTNAHVVEGCGQVSVRYGTRAAPARVVALDRAIDLAVLQTSLSLPGNLAIRREPALRLGESVVAFGFPLAGSLSQAGNLTTGNVSALAGLRDDADTIQISAPVQPGSSGGPLLDASGSVVGVVTAKLDALAAARRTGDIPQNVNFAVRSGVLERFLQANAVRYEQAGAARPLDAADIADIARSAAVRIQCTVGADVSVAAAQPARPSEAVPPAMPSQSAPAPEDTLDRAAPGQVAKDRASLVSALQLLQIATPYPTTGPQLRSFTVRNESLRSVRKITVAWLEQPPGAGCPTAPSAYAGRKEVFISIAPGESSTAMASFPLRAMHFCIVDAVPATVARTDAAPTPVERTPAPAGPAPAVPAGRTPPATSGTPEPGTVTQPPTPVDPGSIPIPEPTVDL
jgi:hypothetical protein